MYEKKGTWARPLVKKGGVKRHIKLSTKFIWGKLNSTKFSSAALSPQAGRPSVSTSARLSDENAKIFGKKRGVNKGFGAQEGWEDIQIFKEKKIETVSRNFNQIGWICTTHLQLVPWICSLSVYFFLVRGGGGHCCFRKTWDDWKKKEVFKKVHACVFAFTTNRLRKTATVRYFPTLGVYCVYFILYFYLCANVFLKKGSVVLYRVFLKSQTVIRKQWKTDLSSSLHLISRKTFSWQLQ
jgi:hypothetical protein